MVKGRIKTLRRLGPPRSEAPWIILVSQKHEPRVDTSGGRGGAKRKKTEKEKKRKQREASKREVRADPNGSSVLLSPGNRVRLLEQEGPCGLPEILDSTPKVRW